MIVTEFEKGDRVRVAFDGIVQEADDETGSVHVWCDSSFTTGVIFPADLTLIAKPLEIGDVVNVIDPDDTLPEPPRCTIVTDASGVAWQKHADTTQRWFSGGSMPKNSLAELARTRGPLTVRYVP